MLPIQKTCWWFLFQTAMRLTLWFILIFAFSAGMSCAFAVRFFYFEAKPVAIQTSEQKAKILVAKRTIPSGIEITADFTTFQEVAVSEIPPRALSSFAQVYRRQPAYPIPAGCPICEDLLIPCADAASQTAFVPVGSQFVTLDVVHVRQGDKVFLPKEPLSTVLAAGQHIDIHIVPRNEGQGKLTEMKNAVLRTFAAHDSKNNGKLILEKIPIHQIQRLPVADHAGLAKDSLMLMLDKSEATKLTAATKKGQVRILVHQEAAKTLPQLAEIENVVEVAESPVQTLLISLPIEEPLPMETSLVLEQSPSILVEPVPAVPMEIVQNAVPAPQPADISDPVPPAPVPALNFALLPVQTNKTPQNFDQQSESLVAPAPLELIIEEKIPIRNDAPVITLGTSTLRVISDRPAERKPTLTELSPTNESEQETIHPYSETIVELPRITSTIQFLPPGKAAPTKEYPKETANRMESTMAPLDISPVMSPVPTIPQERAKVQGYSPWERRGIYTVPSDEDLGENPKDELPPPPRLLRNINADTQAQ